MTKINLKKVFLRDVRHEDSAGVRVLSFGFQMSSPEIHSKSYSDRLQHCHYEKFHVTRFSPFSHTKCT